jgi:hypothetical protein
MVANAIIRLFGLAAIVGIVATAMALWRREVRNPLFLPAAKRKIGPLGKWRVFCAVLGGLLVLATVYGTLMAVVVSYAPSRVPANLTVRVPASPAPVPEVENVPPDSPYAAPGKRVKSARLLATMLVMDARATEPRPLRVVQCEVRWPGQKFVEERFREGNLEYTYQIGIEQVYQQQASVTNRPEEVRVIGQQSLWWEGKFNTKGGDSAGISQPVGSEVRALPARCFPHQIMSPLSVTPGTPPWRYGVLLISLLSENDPLRTVPIAEFVQSERGVLQAGGIYGFPNTQVLDGLEQVPAGGIRLTAYLLGIPMLLLIAAAGLLAQAFRRRDLAFAGLLLGMVLYVAAFDRALLAYDLSRLTDGKQTLQSRLVACNRVGATFFYQDTALQGLREAVGPAVDTPPTLSDRVRETIKNLEHPKSQGRRNGS